jgi:protein-disulfide isomerase-like protein with CxxC motif
MWEFGPALRFSWVMGGLIRRLEPGYTDSEGQIGQGSDPRDDLAAQWLEVAAESGMPVDPRIWRASPLSGTHPACMAVKAAAEQGPEPAYRYLRRLREGILCERRKLDHADPLIAAAGEAGLDQGRFEVDLRSHAITEAFGTDLDEVRTISDEARERGAVRKTEGKERVAFPSAVFVSENGERRGVWGIGGYDELRTAALDAGATPENEGPLEPMDAIERFGRCATAELAELAGGRPLPVLEAELWEAAKEWRLKPVRVLTGTLWERA